MTIQICTREGHDIPITTSLAARRLRAVLGFGLAWLLPYGTASAQSVDTASEKGDAGVQAATPSADASGGGDPAEASRFHLTVGADITTAYFFRGIRQEDSGFILQPYADAALDIIRAQDATVSLKMGTWNSFHDRATLASSNDDFVDKWYESDLYVGLGMVAGKWSFDARYIFYTSPSDAFGTVEEFDFSVAYDDSGLLGLWALRPSATLAVETGSHAADGGQDGTYLQLGVSPGFTFDAGAVKSVAVMFPVVVGLSLSNYYEGAGGENDGFGYASVGIKASVPLPLDSSWGAWSLSVGVQGLFLGDAARTFNEDDDAEVIATVGIAISF